MNFTYTLQCKKYFFYFQRYPLIIIKCIFKALYSICIYDGGKSTNSDSGSFCKIVIFFDSIISFLNLYVKTLNDVRFKINVVILFNSDILNYTEL
jgi:hypothetical protein